MANPITGNEKSGLALPDDFSDYVPSSAYTATDVVAKVASVIGADPAPEEAIAESDSPGTAFADRSISLKLGARTAHERATGGAQTILWDKAGNESIHNVFPKCNIEDLFGETTFGTGVFPAFISNGVEKSVLFFPTYKAYSVGGYACSLEGRDPWNTINFDNARAACTVKNKSGETGWHMASIWDYALVSLWSLRNGFQPRGNTDYGRAHDAKHERAWRVDSAAPGIASGTPRTRNGTGPASWRHDGTPFGIADLVGNTLEWMDGMKLVDGQLYLPSTRDNYHSEAESSWTPTGVFFDSTGTTGTDETASANGAPVLSGERTTPSDDCGDGLGDSAPDYDYASIYGESGARSATMSASYDSLDASIRQMMMQLLISHKINGAGSLPYSAKGYISARNYGVRMPVRGGSWNLGAGAGLAALYLGYRRSFANNVIGFCPAFLL